MQGTSIVADGVTSYPIRATDTAMCRCDGAGDVLVSRIGGDVRRHDGSSRTVGACTVVPVSAGRLDPIFFKPNVGSPEFAQHYGSEDSLSSTAFINLLYENVLGREPDADGFAYWTNKLDTGQTNHGDLLAFFSDSNENIAGTADAVSDGIWFV
ncbi:DUF4214 domain-containing protein [Mesorhizobium sp. A623]